MDIATYLGPKGYSIKKEHITIQEQQLIRKELTVKAFVPKSSLSKPEPFPIYRESPNKIYVPRFYGIDTYGKPDAIKISDGEDINVDFEGGLRDFQKPIVKKYIESAKTKGGGLLEIHCGAGKTVMALKIISELKKKTLVIVHKEFLLQQWTERIHQFLPTAKVGKIQGDVIDIEGKDIVIGMLQSISMRGYPTSLFQNFGLTILDECFPYKTHIHTDKGLIKIGSLYEKWINKEDLPNILSFNQTTKKIEYKKMTHAWRKEREDLIKIKMSKRVINCTPEHKILTINGYTEANKLKEGDLIVSKYDENHIDNIISAALNKDQLQMVYASYLGDGHIGITKKNRYRLCFTHGEKQKGYCEWKANMFGITKLTYIEKNGYAQKPAYTFRTKIFDMENKITKNTKLVPDWLLDKLDERGIAIWYMDDGSINKHKLKDGGVSNYISIHSNNFNYETHEKFVKKFKQYGIVCTINKSKGKYYYLRFNKDNAQKLLELIKPYVHETMEYKINTREELYKWNNEFLDYGLLKVSSISYFKNKGANRCKKPYVYDIEVEDNHNFVIGSYPLKDNPQYIDGPIVSNCHHMAAAVFSNALFKIVTKYMLGLSATMDRKDKLSFVFKMFIGDVVYKKEREGDDVVVVKGINYEVDDDKFEKVDKMYNGQTNYSGMIKKLCEFEKRSDFILKVLDDSLKEKPEQQFIVLAHNKSILKYLHDSIQERGLHTVGYYVGGMKQKDLKISETKKIIIATYAMAEEALDIKTLTSLLMATPKTDVRQAVGRILRKKKSNALVFDIIDMHGLFQRQWKKRCTWYRKQKYTVLLANNEQYNKNMWATLSTNGQRLKHKAAPDQFSNLLQGVCLVK
jgi:superfamily II DNA or RNA helicase